MAPELERDYNDTYACGCCRCCGCSCDDYDLFGYYDDDPVNRYADYNGDEDNMPDDEEEDGEFDDLDEFEDATFEPFKPKKTRLRERDQ